MSGSYAAAGVDVEAGERAIDLFRASVAATAGPEVVGSVGGFAGLYDASALRAYRRPLLATSTDGVGTKVAVAQRLGIHNTVGIDLVAMVVDDLVVCGARPLYMTDYIAIGKVIPEVVAELVAGVAHGCRLAGCALLGGETAEHPGLLRPDEYDLAGAGTGIVEADDLLGAHRVRPGDVLIAMASSGLHSNGYSLARQVLLERRGLDLADHVDVLGRSLGEELLEPTRIYALDCLALIGAAEVHAMSHITGGGIVANVARVLPDALAADIDRTTWSVPAVFDLIADRGDVSRSEMERTFNMGIGMVAVVGATDAGRALDVLMGRGVPAWVCGTVRDKRGGEVSSAPAKGGGRAAVHLV